MTLNSQISWLYQSSPRITDMSDSCGSGVKFRLPVCCQPSFNWAASRAPEPHLSEGPTSAAVCPSFHLQFEMISRKTRLLEETRFVSLPSLFCSGHTYPRTKKLNLAQFILLLIIASVLCWSCSIVAPCAYHCLSVHHGLTRQGVHLCYPTNSLPHIDVL